MLARNKEDFEIEVETGFRCPHSTKQKPLLQAVPQISADHVPFSSSGPHPCAMYHVCASPLSQITSLFYLLIYF